MVEKIMCFNLKFHHIAGTTKCHSWLHVQANKKNQGSQNFPLSDPILADYAVVKKIAYKSEIETEDPWVEKLATAAMLDTDYVAMIAHIELGTELGDIPKDCELANMGSNWEELSVVTLKGGKV